MYYPSHSTKSMPLNGSGEWELTLVKLCNVSTWGGSSNDTALSLSACEGGPAPGMSAAGLIFNPPYMPHIYVTYMSYTCKCHTCHTHACNMHVIHTCYAHACNLHVIHVMHMHVTCMSYMSCTCMLHAWCIMMLQPQKIVVTNYYFTCTHCGTPATFIAGTSGCHQPMARCASPKTSFWDGWMEKKYLYFCYCWRQWLIC